MNPETSAPISYPQQVEQNPTSQTAGSAFFINAFTKGIHNRMDPSVIPDDAGQNGLNWLTVDGRLALKRGQTVFGNESTTSGGINNIFVAYTTTGTPVYFRQTLTSFQYLLSNVWTNTNVTTLSSTDRFTWTPYVNLTQNSVFIAGPTGLYKINVANPANVITYTKPISTSRYIWGYMTIIDGRGYRWHVTQPNQDLTALYLSWIDAADSNGTTVTNQTLATGNGVLTTFTGTLTLTGNEQPHSITIQTSPASVTGQVNLDGNIIGTGISGTVNLTTGAYSITFATAPAVATLIQGSYVRVDDATKGVLDNTITASPFQGKSFRADVGGDSIQYITQGIDGSIIVIKQSNTYRFIPDTLDVSSTMQVYRKDLGVQSLNSAVPTVQGIYVINTVNTTFPQLILLQKNPFGDNILSIPQVQHFDFTPFDFALLQMLAWDRYIVASCRSNNSIAYNDRLILIDVNRNTVDIVEVENNYIYKDRNTLYACSPFGNNTYTLFSGFTVDDDVITNFWETKEEDYSYPGLKKMKRFFIKGRISPSQKLQIYVSTDHQPYVLIGTIIGTQSYVDASSLGTVGANGVGADSVGGGAGTATVFDYLTQFKTKIPKYRVRVLKFVATGIGYIDISQYYDNRIERSEMRIPKNYRIQNNVSKDGTTTNVFPFPTT